MVKAKNKIASKKKNAAPKKKKVAIVKKDHEDIFREICYDYASRHAGDLTLTLLMNDPLVARAVVSWPNVDRHIEIKGDPPTNPWDAIWYDRNAWMDSARIPEQHRKSVMMTVIKNNLVFADGNMSDASRAYLLVKARVILGTSRNTNDGNTA